MTLREDLPDGVDIDAMLRDLRARRARCSAYLDQVIDPTERETTLHYLGHLDAEIAYLSDLPYDPSRGAFVFAVIVLALIATGALAYLYFFPK
jgi:hypothetical protein